MKPLKLLKEIYRPDKGVKKYIDFSIKGLRPLALKQKFHEYMIEHPNSNWDQFTNHVISKDLTIIVATDPANESTTDKMPSLETQIKELTKLIKNQEVSAINYQNSFQRRHLDIKGRPYSTRFCEYCRMNGHSISRCSKKQVQDEVNKLRKLCSQSVTPPPPQNKFVFIPLQKEGKCYWNNSYNVLSIEK